MIEVGALQSSEYILVPKGYAEDGAMLLGQFLHGVEELVLVITFTKVGKAADDGEGRGPWREPWRTSQHLVQVVGPCQPCSQY